MAAADTEFLVLYAKVVDDKEMGALMTGIFIGGICRSEKEADELAKRCVSETQGGIIIPRVAPVDADLKDVIQDLESQFDLMADRMYDNEQILNKNNRKR